MFLLSRSKWISKTWTIRSISDGLSNKISRVFSILRNNYVLPESARALISIKVLLENGWNSKQMITEGEAAIPLETTLHAFRNQEKTKQWSTIVLKQNYVSAFYCRPSDFDLLGEEFQYKKYWELPKTTDLENVEEEAIMIIGTLVCDCGRACICDSMCLCCFDALSVIPEDVWNFLNMRSGVQWPATLRAQVKMFRKCAYYLFRW